MLIRLAKEDAYLLFIVSLLQTDVREFVLHVMYTLFVLLHSLPVTVFFLILFILDSLEGSILGYVMYIDSNMYLHCIISNLVYCIIAEEQ